MKLAGRYRLLNALGEGSVRLAFDEELHRDVAVKELRYPAEPAELRVAAEVRHPSIVPVFDVLVEDGRPWLVMEFVSGSSLERSVLARHPLPVVQAARIGVHLLDALTTAHTAGLVHGRVNPGNVMLTIEGKAILTGLCGPRPVLPPSSDLWSLAATLHFALEGRPPGDAPAQGGDPMRVLIRNLLSASGQPPLATVSGVLNDVAMNRRPRGRHAFAAAPKREWPPPPEPFPGPLPEPPPPPPPLEPSPSQEPTLLPSQEPPPAELDRPALLVTAGAGLRRVLRRRRHHDDQPTHDQALSPPPPVDERTLDQVIGATGPLPPIQVAAIALAVLDQLAALHARGEHHADIRPGTILFDDGTLQAPVMPSGISAYTAPEGSIGPASDLWSLGATLYTAVEGTPPSPGAPLSRAGALAPVLFRLLAGEPAHRPSIDALRRDLTAITG